MANWYDSAPASGDKPKNWFDDAPPQEDPIRQKARKELQDKGLLDRGNLANLTDMGRKGYTLGFNDEMTAAALTPIEMIRQRTFNPAEAYRFAKAREDILQEEAKKATGVAGMGAEILGGAAMGGRLAQGGLSLMRPGQSTLARIGAGTVEGGLYGATSGLGDAKSLSEAPAEMLKGGAIGAGAGGAITAAAPIVSTLGRNAMGWASATVNPEGFAQRQLARALSESGMTPSRVAQEVAAGNAAGQPYTIADALGNPGQRMLSSVARAPGTGRTQTVDFLDARQGDQGRRLAAILSEGFDAPQTAAQTRAAMETARGNAANVNYGAARAQAGAVDVTPAITEADNFLQPGVTRMLNPGNNIADDTVEAAVRRARAFLTDGRSQITDFSGAQRAKMELDAMIEGARPTVQRQLIPIRNALDNALATSSPPYAQARNQFRQQSQAIEAIDTGRAAATRGRTEDTTAAFAGLGPDAQQGFRVGYVDPLIEKMQGPAAGVNKARDFTSLSAEAELPYFAAQGPGRSQNVAATRPQEMMAGIGRENRMFETRAAATGGSKTADNLADMQSTGVDPVGIISNLASGTIGGYGAALRNLMGRSSGTLSGYTPQVREQLARLLLAGDGTTLEPMLRQIAGNDEARRRILASYLSGALAGTGQGQSSARR
jgi:hypothetical protein